MLLTLLKLVGTYESAMTKKFLAGRTETVRSATKEALAFAKHLKLDQTNAMS